MKSSAATFEGHTTGDVEGDWKREQRDIPAGSLFVPIAQPRLTLAMTLLEPKDPDSYLSWGFFNTSFERKEYMEAYVAEAVARRDAEEGSGCEEGVRAQACGRSGFRVKSGRTPGFLLPALAVVG